MYGIAMQGRAGTRAADTYDDFNCAESAVLPAPPGGDGAHFGCRLGILDVTDR